LLIELTARLFRQINNSGFSILLNSKQRNQILFREKNLDFHIVGNFMPWGLELVKLLAKEFFFVHGDNERLVKGSM
jgi:hypothetical protein